MLRQAADWDLQKDSQKTPQAIRTYNGAPAVASHHSPLPGNCFVRATQFFDSEMLGKTPNHLSAVERGASGISLEALQRLCRLLGVGADRIIFGTDKPEAKANRVA